MIQGKVCSPSHLITLAELAVSITTAATKISGVHHRPCGIRQAAAIPYTVHMQVNSTVRLHCAPLNMWMRA